MIDTSGTIGFEIFYKINKQLITETRKVTKSTKQITNVGIIAGCGVIRGTKSSLKLSKFVIFTFEIINFRRNCDLLLDKQATAE